MSEAVLLDTPVVTVTARGGTVRVVVENRTDVGPEEGASIARRLVDTLTHEVLVPDSRYRGLVIDVRNGPDVFGPKTRDALETLFRAAEAAKIRLGVVVRSTTQRLQFDSMSGLYAPTVSRLFDDPEPALEFVHSAPG